MYTFKCVCISEHVYECVYTHEKRISVCAQNTRREKLFPKKNMTMHIQKNDIVGPQSQATGVIKTGIIRPLKVARLRYYCFTKIFH